MRGDRFAHRHQDGHVSLNPCARMGDVWARELVQVSRDVAVLESGGRWAVAIPYAGVPVLAQFATWSRGASPPSGVDVGDWTGPAAGSWQTSMDESAYCEGVAAVREAIAEGTVYQANLCRVMSALMPEGDARDVAALDRLLASGNPSPHGGFLRLPEHGVHVASASPELFLSVMTGPGGREVLSGPIKGTGRTEEELAEKDRAENVMIVDLVRNDLSRVSIPGTVSVPDLLRVEHHPGLVHLVSRVRGELRPEVGWQELLEATFPPGSVTGAPKSSALRIIRDVETASRDYYCGAFGWIDADSGEAELAVAIRTFWCDDEHLRFGTGAGITWASDASAEWRETELKARRLVEVASGSWKGGAS